MQRLVAHAEEVAYNDPPSGTAEQLILNQHLSRLLRHNRLSAFQRFVQQVSCISVLLTTLCAYDGHANIATHIHTRPHNTVGDRNGASSTRFHRVT